MALAGIRRHVVQIKEIDKDDLRAGAHGATEGSTRLFRVLDLYWRSPESGDLRHTSRKLKKTV